MSKTIYLAGGCFWGIEAYFSKLYGVINTKTGYANGSIENPAYEDVCSEMYGFSETVMVEYDENEISLKEILYHFFDIIDPTSINRQGADVGIQYRSGIYYTDDNDALIIDEVIKEESKRYNEPVTTEVLKLENFYPAEEYHQKYLDKNPGGYCHIDLSKFNKYKKPVEDELLKKLSPLQYVITQRKGTEPPFSSEYYDNKKNGIYVDIVSGEPLFASTDKYNSGTGWPSFVRPISESSIKVRDDSLHNMERKEVLSAIAGSHLGHVFDDGPEEHGGKRYCINGASLLFIPEENLESEGYGEFLKLFK